MKEVDYYLGMGSPNQPYVHGKLFFWIFYLPPHNKKSFSFPFAPKKYTPYAHPQTRFIKKKMSFSTVKNSLFVFWFWEPTQDPNFEPTLQPTPEPTSQPTPEPTYEPTYGPTFGNTPNFFFVYVKKIICKNFTQRPEKYSFREKKKTNQKIIFIPKRCKKKEGKVCKKQKSVQKTKISAKSWKKGFCDKFQGF